MSVKRDRYVAITAGGCKPFPGRHWSADAGNVTFLYAFTSVMDRSIDQDHRELNQDHRELNKTGPQTSPRVFEKENAMLKLASICAASILAVAAFSNSAEAQRLGGGARMGGHSGFSGGARMGGNFGGARMGGFSGARMGIAGAGIYRGGIGPGRVGALGGRGIYRGGVGSGRYAYGYGNQGYRYGYGGYRYGHRGYWPYLGLGVGALALASTRPYYDGGYYDGGYSYGGYGNDDSGVAYCIQQFRSYDPASRTYLGNDGYRHPCP